MHDVSREKRALLVQGIDLKISSMYGAGKGDPIVFLHGFGSTKEDYADIARLPAFKGRRFIAYDAPGCGESECGDLSAVNVPFLVNTAREVLSRFAVDRFHLVGHLVSVPFRAIRKYFAFNCRQSSLGLNAARVLKKTAALPPAPP